MHKTPCMDLGIVLVVNNLGRGSLIIIILAKTLNGLDAVHNKKQHSLWRVPFFSRYNP